MDMQQFRRWVARLLDVLPWRSARRSPKTQTRARMTSPSQANRFPFSEDHAVRRQKVETNPLCSTLHADMPREDVPAPHEPPTLPQPRLLPAPEAASAPMLALPSPPAAGASDAASAAAPAGAAQPPCVDPERRLAFARYLFRRGVFNEGFTSDSLPAQYRDQTPEA